MSQQAYFNAHADRTYLDVLYEQKDDVKSLGARWDAACPRGPYAFGKWYIPQELDGKIEAFAQWLPPTHPKSAAYIPPAQNKDLNKKKRALERKEAQLKATEQRQAKEKLAMEKREQELKDARKQFDEERKAQIAANAAERQEMRDLMKAQLAAFAALAPGGHANAARGQGVAANGLAGVKAEPVAVKEENEVAEAPGAGVVAAEGAVAADGAGPSMQRGIKRERSADDVDSVCE